MSDAELHAPRDDVIRTISLERAAVSTGDGNTLVGYPIVFNEWAEIDSWEGKFRERIAPGAVNQTLRVAADQVVVMFNHGFDPQIGDKPLGKPRVMEPRKRGLWTETPLDGTSYNEDLKALLRSGALHGMSFRFSVQNETWNTDTDDGIPERTINELKLYEFGPVTFPAYQATTAGVRNAGGFTLWRESFGREGGLPRAEGPQAVPPAGEGSGTSDEAAAPDAEGRHTSRADDEFTTLARADQIRLARELEQEGQRIRWVRQTT